jgi:hypothetical protein
MPSKIDRGAEFPRTISILPKHRNVILALVTKENNKRAAEGKPPVGIATFMHMLVERVAAQEGLMMI